MVHNIDRQQLAQILSETQSEDYGRYKQSVEDLKECVQELDTRMDKMEIRLAVLTVKIAWWSSVAATIINSAFGFVISHFIKNGGGK